MKRTTPIVVFLMLTACAGTVKTQFASTASMSPVAGPFMLRVVPGDRNDLEKAADTAVVASLIKQGWSRADTASRILDVAITARPAPVSATTPAGALLSAAKKSGCRDARLYRLSIAVVDAATGKVALRSWAEERHCKAAPLDVVQALADKAGGAVSKPGEAGISERPGII